MFGRAATSRKDARGAHRRESQIFANRTEEEVRARCDGLGAGAEGFDPLAAQRYAKTSAGVGSGVSLRHDTPSACVAASTAFSDVR